MSTKMSVEFQIVRAHSRRGYYVNENHWDQNSKSYGGWFRSSAEIFRSRAAAESYVRARAEAMP